MKVLFMCLEEFDDDDDLHFVGYLLNGASFFSMNFRTELLGTGRTDIYK